MKLTDYIWQPKNDGAIAVCALCGAVQEGTSASGIEHWNTCSGIGAIAHADRIIEYAKELSAGNGAAMNELKQQIKFFDDHCREHPPGNEKNK